jgi:hypothetical protein
MADWKPRKKEKLMLKNTTRRSLSLAAVISLGVSALAGLPAQASTDVLVAPAGGTSYVTLVDQTFIIQAGVGAGVPTANLTSLKWKVEKADDFALDVTASNTVDSSVLTPDVAVAAATESYVVESFTNSGTVRALALKLDSNVDPTSASQTVTVTAWLDTLDNDTVDAGESSTTVTVTFKKYSEVAPVITLTQPIQGDTRVTASATVPGLNLDQLTAGSLSISFAVGGSAIAGPSVFTSGGDAVGTVSAAIAANATVSAEVGYAGSRLGAVKTLTVTNQTIEDVTASAVVSANAKMASNDTNVEFRANTAFAVRAYTSTSSSETVVAGVPVTFVFSGGSLTGTTKVMSVNGAAFTSSAVTVTATTGADGYATVNLITDGFADTNTIGLTVRAQNQTQTITLTAKTPVFTPAVDGSNYRYATPGSTLALAFDVADQYEVASTRTNQEVQVSYVDADGDLSTLSGAVANGVAAVSIPVGSATGSATVTYRLRTLNPDTLLWTAGSDVASVVTISVTASAAVFDGTAFAATKSSAVAGTVTYSGSVSIPGATVVVAAQGIVFTDADGDTFSNQVSILTGADGDFAFTASGTVSGDYEIRATVGADVMTSSYTVDAAAYNTGENVTIAGADTSLQGKTVIYTVLVTDEYGNPVETEGTTGSVTVTFTGPGIFSGVLPTKTDEDGELVFSLQTASNDEGTIALTVTYNNEGADTAAADKVSATKLTTVTAPVVMTAQTVSVVVSAETIEAGRNADVTITVTDTAGNPHANKDVSVYSTGAGYLSAQTVRTDANGKAVVKLITATNDSGTATITASVDDKIGTATVTVAAPVVVVTPTVEAVIGTFQGRWAVRVENATVGDRITIRVGGNWYQFNYSSETGSQLFSRKSTVGAIVDVTVWVNGSQKNVGLVTIK